MGSKATTRFVAGKAALALAMLFTVAHSSGLPTRRYPIDKTGKWTIARYLACFNDKCESNGAAPFAYPRPNSKCSSCKEPMEFAFPYIGETVEELPTGVHGSYECSEENDKNARYFEKDNGGWWEEPQFVACFNKSCEFPLSGHFYNKPRTDTPNDPCNCCEGLMELAVEPVPVQPEAPFNGRRLIDLEKQRI